MNHYPTPILTLFERMPGSSCVDLRFESPTGVVAESRVTSATSAASDSDTSSGTVATPSDVTVTVSARPRSAAAPRATGSDSATVSVCLSVCLSVYVPGCHLQLSEYMGKYLLLCLFSVAFSALTLLVEGHPAGKNLSGGGSLNAHVCVFRSMCL